MSERIEMVQSVDEDGHIIFRAKGIVRYDIDQLAADLGVDKSQLVYKVDPVLWKAEQKRLRRHRPVRYAGSRRPMKPFGFTTTGTSELRAYLYSSF